MRSVAISDRPLYKVSPSPANRHLSSLSPPLPSSTSRSPSRSRPRRRQRRLAVGPPPPGTFAPTRSTSSPLPVAVALRVTELGYVESLDQTFLAMFFSVQLDLSNRVWL